jgi:hypothetical protein
MRGKLFRILLFIVLVMLVYGRTQQVMRERAFNPITSDAEGYYQYLTAIFIKHDITDQPYSFYLEDGRLFNKYTCGVAMLEMPFFLGAHSYVLLKYPERATGKTLDYVHGLQLSTAFYLIAGMFFLYYFLRRYFPPLVIVASLLTIYAATNLYFYTHFECGMSHVYSFFLFAAFIYYTPYFLQFTRIRYTVIIALLLGISVLLRPTNIIVSLFILLYDVYSFNDLRARFSNLLRHWKQLLIFPLAVLVIYTPQMYYWYSMLGRPFVNSYRYDFSVTGFIYWKHPKIFRVLAGHRSGWLLYSPVMVLSLIGMVWLYIKKAYHSQAVMIVFLILLYLAASWSAYTFGTAYGFRPFIELYSFLSIPFTFIIYRIIYAKGLAVKLIGAFFVMNCVYLNFKMMDHYFGAWDGLGWRWGDYFNLIRTIY